MKATHVVDGLYLKKVQYFISLAGWENSAISGLKPQGRFLFI